MYEMAGGRGIWGRTFPPLSMARGIRPLGPDGVIGSSPRVRPDEAYTRVRGVGGGEAESSSGDQQPQAPQEPSKPKAAQPPTGEQSPSSPFP